MVPGRLVVVMVLVTVAAPVGVGAASPGAPAEASTALPSTPSGENTSAAPSLGQSISGMMQASLAQTAGSVENGMWAAAYANASTASEKRALVERRASRLNGSIRALREERKEVRAAFRNGTINRTTYLARLSTIVGRIASLSEGIEATADRGAAVGVNQSRLHDLRTQARNLSGPAVSRLARNLGAGSGPGPPGLFEQGPPGQAGPPGSGNGSDRASDNQGPDNRGGNASNSSSRGDNPGSGGADNASNRADGGNETGASGNASSESDSTQGQAGSGKNTSSGNGNGAGDNGNGAGDDAAGNGSAEDGDRDARTGADRAVTGTS